MRTVSATVSSIWTGVSAVTARALAPDSVLTGAIADATLTADDLGANAVGMDELADNAVGQAEIRNNGVAASEIADRSIDGGEVIDGGLLVRDIARFSGTLEVRIPTAVVKHTCVAAIVTDTPATKGVQGDSAKPRPRTRFYLTAVDSLRTWRPTDCGGMRVS